MKTTLAIFAAAALALAVNSPANAKGCIKGAVVGGVAGHYAGHHGVLGAAAGCLYGRHHAKEQERARQLEELGRIAKAAMASGRVEITREELIDRMRRKAAEAVAQKRAG